MATVGGFSYSSAPLRYRKDSEHRQHPLKIASNQASFIFKSPVPADGIKNKENACRVTLGLLCMSLHSRMNKHKLSKLEEFKRLMNVLERWLSS